MTSQTTPGAGSGPRTRTARSWASRPVTLGWLLLGGLVAVVASAQPWWRASGTDAQVAFTGAEATGGLSQALAVVTLAGSLLVLVLKLVGRRVLGVLLAVAGMSQTVVGLLRQQPSGETVRSRIREVSLADQYALSPTLWPWVTALAGVLVILGATALLVGSASWTTTRSRFEREALQPQDVVAADDPAGLWKAMDAGLDPTDPERQDTPDDTDPDVHNESPGDTMGANRHQQHPGRPRSHRMESDGIGPAGRSAHPPE